MWLREREAVAEVVVGSGLGFAGLESPAHKKLTAGLWRRCGAGLAGAGRVLTNAATSTRELELPPTRNSTRELELPPTSASDQRHHARSRARSMRSGGTPNHWRNAREKLLAFSNSSSCATSLTSRLWLRSRSAAWFIRSSCK